MPDTLPAQIACSGRYLVALIQPWASYGCAVAIDCTILLANGGVWHKKDREQGIVPHTSIDTAAHWTKSGWHGWCYGWKLHLVATAAAVWIPLAADLTAANEADNEAAPALLRELPAAAGFVLGDLHYNAPNVQECCDQTGRILVTTQYGPYPHTGDDVEVRRLFHKLRSVAIENFNEQFKGIFDSHGQVPTKGLRSTRRFALGAILLYQSDTPGKAGGLLSTTASKAVVLLNRRSGTSKGAVVCNALKDRSGSSVRQCLSGRFAAQHKMPKITAWSTLRQPTLQVAAQAFSRRWRSSQA